MALEIKVLDYGDIELESSFLVLGRDCGRVRRVPTLGMLVLGGTWPILIDTGYRSNQIMETLGMRGLQSHENMIENQLKKHGLRLGDVRYVLHTHLHIDHAGKDDLFPMNTTVIVNRRELEYSVSGLMHPQYPAVDSKHLIDRLRTKGALRFLDLEISGPTELMPGLDLRVGRRPHRRLDERDREDRGRGGDSTISSSNPSVKSATWSRASPATTELQSVRRRLRSRKSSPRRVSCCRSTIGRR